MSSRDFEACFSLESELTVGISSLKPGSIVELAEVYSFQNSVQLCLKSKEHQENWYSIKHAMNIEERCFALLSYPPAFFDGADVIPLVLVELLTDKRIRTLDEIEFQQGIAEAKAAVDRSAPLDLFLVEAALGGVPDWSEIKHRF